MDEKSQAAYCTPVANTRTLAGELSGDITAAPGGTVRAASAYTPAADQTTNAQTIDIAAGGTVELWWELT